MKPTQQQKDFIRQNEQENIRELALKLDKDKYRELDVEFVLKQISGRQTAKHKIPAWYAADEIVYPIHISLEQASSEATARYKAALVADESKTFVDLTGGMGVDFAFLSRRFEQSVYVEQNVELCEIAGHNFKVLGLKNVAVKNEESEAFLKNMPPVDVIYLDPSRRDNVGKKVVGIEDCTPNVLEIQEQLLQKSRWAMVKFSPMLDISLAVKKLKNVREVHIVSVENETKELLFILSSCEKSTNYIAVNLNKNEEIEKFCFTTEEEQNAQISLSAIIGKYLYEPNASVLKAGAFKSVASRFNIQKLHKNSHLYTSDTLIKDFPGRIFNVQDCFSPNKKNIKNLLAETEKANISVRNFPMSVAEIRQKTGLKEGGEVYLFATTVADEKKVWIVCKKL